MNININIDDYLDETEIKEIVKEELREAVSYQLKTSREIDTCISNLSYRYVWDMVNDLYKEYDVDFGKMLLEKVKSIIDGLSSYSVFRDSTPYGDKISVGQEMLNKIVEDSRPQIEKRVVEIINNYDFRELKEEISDTIYECIWNKFKVE